MDAPFLEAHRERRLNAHTGPHPLLQAVVARPEALGVDALAVDGLLSFVTFELE